MSAHCDKGVLKISLAKKAEAKPTQIKLNIGEAKVLEAKASGKAAQNSGLVVTVLRPRYRA
ncbi:MAG: hypothetical protein WBX22_14620 [Silvibacterium sp.]